jgi:LPS export ABC transporter protein LptC/lipopolysaccharide transport protein LptA
MTRWQRRARWLIGLFAITFAVFVARQFRSRPQAPVSTTPMRVDPGAVVETTGGNFMRFNGQREDVHVKSEKQLIYADGSSHLLNVTIDFNERNGTRTFTVRSKEGHIGKGEAAIALDGDVQLEGSDGMKLHTEHATYADSDATVRAPGPVEYTRARMTGRGVGMTWDKNRDYLSILDQAVIHTAADEQGAGAMDITSGTADIARKEKYMRFLHAVRIERAGQIIESDNVVATLTADEKHVENVDLHDGARITMTKAAPGALQSMTGHDMSLKYRADGDVLEHALVTGDSAIQLAGDTGTAGRQITAKTLDIALAPDGVTPTALIGHDGVQLTFPPEPGAAGRTIRAATLESKGEAGKGLTRALFTGSVQFREQGPNVDRAATSLMLDLALKPGMSAIDDAKFSHTVHFEEGTMAAQAAAARYDPEKGTLDLSGSEPGAVVPHVVNQQIVVDAVTVNVTLEGPKVKAEGNVKSELKPAAKGTNDVKMPSMLKQDQSVIVVAKTLDYDGTTSKGTYTGEARLFQGDTSIKGETIVVDDKLGNLSASGGVASTTVLDSTDKDKQKQRARSIATGKDLTYDDTTRRLRYTGDAHLNGPDGDMKAERIDLYLKESGDELERAEGYEKLTLREQNRETTGNTMVYTTADEKYVIVGTPVKIIDECERETIGRTLTFFKSTNNIVVDGNSQVRTQTKGGNGKCTS